MYIIFKYELKGNFSNGPITTKIPTKNKILDINVQGDKFFLWAVVDTDDKQEQEVECEIYGTGWPIKDPENLIYIKTVYHGRAVWHIFKRVKH